MCQPHSSTQQRFHDVLHRCRVLCWLAWLLILSTAVGVFAQDAADLLPERLPPTDNASAPPSEIELLRRRIEQLEANDLKQQTATDELRSSKATDSPTLKMGGQLVVDSLWFSQGPQSRAAVGDVDDAVDFRRARLYGTGEAYDIFTYAIGFDFAQGSANNGRPAFIDNWVQVNDLPTLGNVRVGHFFEPFSLERNTSNRNTTFLERSLPDAFAPSRNTGIMTFSESVDQTWYWALGSFHESDNFGDDAGDQLGVTADGRLCYRPYYDEPSNGRYYLHTGYAYSFRQANDGELQYQSRPEAFGRSDEASIATPFFVNTGVLDAHYNQLHGLEFLWVHGPLLVQSEIMIVPADLIGQPNATFNGGYLHVTYFLTGEHRPYNRELAILDRVRPFENFFRVRGGDGSILTGTGAWELAARLSRIDLTNADVEGGRLTNFTFGVNWYLTPYHRMKFNYILSHLDEVAAAPSDTSIFGLRFDWDF